MRFIINLRSFLHSTATFNTGHDPLLRRVTLRYTTPANVLVSHNYRLRRLGCVTRVWTFHLALCHTHACWTWHLWRGDAICLLRWLFVVNSWFFSVCGRPDLSARW